jgi:purine-binding chemotaxis protein CheW
MADTVGVETKRVIAEPGLYLTFALAGEEYGLEILRVQEIIGMLAVTGVPRTPEYVRGVVNLRGKVIPVIDLRLKFGMPSLDDTDRTCIIVVEVLRSGQKAVMGIIVDEVSEVLDIKGEQIEPPPSFGASVHTEAILGMGKAMNKVIMLIDIDEALAGGEVELLKNTETGA